MITLISAIDMADGIGDEEGKLLYNIPKDLEHFKNTTLGGVVVMGRKTWDSLKRKPLLGRKNYVLTNDKDFNPDGAKVLNSIDDIINLSKTYSIFIIGGGELYKQMIEHADNMIITHVHEINISATSFFPPFSHEDWKIDEMNKYDEEGKVPSYTIAKYSRINTNKK